MKTEKIKIFENRQFAAELISYFSALTGVLNKVKTEYESLDIGQFNEAMCREFITQGPESIIGHYQAAFEDATKDLPMIVRKSLSSAPRDENVKRFADYFKEILDKAKRIGDYFANTNLQDRNIYRSLINRFELIKINPEGIVEFPESSEQVILDAFTFWAESPKHLKLMDLCRKFEITLAEINSILKDSGFDNDYTWSFPNDRFEGLFNFDGDRNVIFDQRFIRFIE